MARLAVVALMALLVVCSTATQVRLTSAQEKQIKELKKEKWGAILFTLAELQVQSQGPFEELVEAVGILVDDIDSKIAANDEAFNERSLQHQSETTRLGDLITTTQVQISNAENVLNNILYPTRQQLQAKLDGFHAEIDENNAYVAKITFEREEAHAAYEVRVAEHNAALSAVDECLEILGNFGGSLSLLQVKKIQNSITKVTKTLKRGVEESMIKALVSLATNEFADQSAILKVVQALQEVKQSIIDALNQEHDDEKASVAQYNSEVAARESDNKRLNREINITNGELDSTERRISAKETFLAEKQNDLRNFTNELDAENEAFEEATNFYEDVRTQLQREQSVAADTRSLLNNAGFSASIMGNMGL